MARKISAPPGAVLTGLAVGLFFINYGFARAGWPPFLYCYGKEIAAAVYAQLREFAVLTLMVAVAFHSARMEWRKAFIASGLMLLVMGMPTFSDILFRAGGSCG